MTLHFVLVALHLTPQPGEPGDSEELTARVEERVDERKRLAIDGMQVLARGAMVCPGCALPIAPAQRAKPRARMRCTWCGHAGIVADFVRGDIVDTPANEVRVVARIG
jgi:hypothetical protein